MSNPYESLGPEAYWKNAVAQRHALDINRLWQPKAAIHKQQRIVTAGSCFAQHIGRALAKNGYSWVDGEPAPGILSESLAKAFNYGIFSFRTGNIYTARALLQWVRWALGLETPPAECWETGGRHYDPYRPAIEPNGFATLSEVIASRKATLRSMRATLLEADVFVFTLGLTEAWKNTRTGLVYAMCPGTVAGRFDPAQHAFVNFRASEIMKDLRATFDALKSVNPKIRFLLTVSPVPLVATASGEHVLVATTFSKSTLRSVAGELADERDDTDYFPSYEIITGAPFRAMFYEPNLRSVVPQGVDFVMRSFFDCLAHSFGPPAETAAPAARVAEHKEAEVSGDENEDELVCEEEMLKAFGPK